MVGFNKGGVMAGLYVDYRFTPTWSGSFEMLYDMKGSKRLYTVDANGNAVSDIGGSWDQLNLSYLEIPFLAHYHLNKNFEIYAGPAIGILISSSYYPGQASIGSIGGEAPADFLKSYDFSGYFGVTYHFAAHWSGTVRYNNSLISFANGKSNPYGYINTGLTNIVITGGIYYDFVENKLN